MFFACNDTAVLTLNPKWVRTESQNRPRTGVQRPRLPSLVSFLIRFQPKLRRMPLNLGYLSVEFLSDPDQGFE